MFFVVWCHLHSCFRLNFTRNGEHYDRRNGETLVEQVIKILPIAINCLFLLVEVIAIVFLPILAWYDIGIASLATNYWTQRYLLLLLYMIIELFPFPAIDNFSTLIADGLLLSQITSIYMYNTTSLKLTLSLVPVHFMVFSGKQAFDVLLYELEKKHKSTFVRLLGVHDTLYLILIFSLVIGVTSTIDAFTSDWLCLLNWFYLAWAIYSVNRMMDEKPSKLQQSNCFTFNLVFMTTVFSALYLFIQFQVHATKEPLTADRLSYPLYKASLLPIIPG